MDRFSYRKDQKVGLLVPTKRGGPSPSCGAARIGALTFFPGERSALERGAVAAFAVGLLPAAVASANGGYCPPSWGWAALAFAGIAAIALLMRPLPPLRTLGPAAALLVLAVWTL